MKWNGMTLVGRKQWGAKRAVKPTRHTLSPRSILFVHYSAGQGRSIDTRAEQVATMQAIQRMHQVDNGWSDIGYHFVVFQPYGRLKRASVFQGRSLRNAPAAQENYNTGNVAVCVIAAPGEKVKRSTVRRIKSIYKRLPATSVKGHRDVGATACPGDHLYAVLPQIRKVKT